MASTAARRLVVRSMIGGLVAALCYGCSGVNPDPYGGVLSRNSIQGFVILKSFQREAKGGGFVTVDVALKPGGVPSWSSPPVSPDTIGWFSNRGEGGKHEKRYDFKSAPDTVYQLVTSYDGSGRTKWTIYELQGLAHTVFKSGHLWPCDSFPHTVYLRDMGFKSCGLPVTYPESELAFTSAPSHYFLASFVRTDSDDEELLLSPAAWISCTTGCCSLGT
jgi:hypothetical protein